jgi:hypothetical protein
MTCHFVTQAFLRLVAGRSVKLKELQLAREEKRGSRTDCLRSSSNFFFFISGVVVVVESEREIKKNSTRLAPTPQLLAKL